MPARYKIKPGAFFKAKDAGTIVKFLSKEFPDGSYTPEEIVQKASKPSSPIHKFFQWDNARAAHLYRISQARKMIQAVVVEIIDPHGKHYDTPIAVSINTGSGARYWDIGKVSEIPDGWDLVLKDAVDGLRSWSLRYKNLRRFTELKGVFKAIEKFERKPKWLKKQQSKPKKSKRSVFLRSGSKRSTSRSRDLHP